MNYFVFFLCWDSCFCFTSLSSLLSWDRNSTCCLRYSFWSLSRLICSSVVKSRVVGLPELNCLVSLIPSSLNSCVLHLLEQLEILFWPRIEIGNPYFSKIKAGNGLLLYSFKNICLFCSVYVFPFSLTFLTYWLDFSVYNCSLVNVLFLY